MFLSYCYFYFDVIKGIKVGKTFIERKFQCSLQTLLLLVVVMDFCKVHNKMRSKILFVDN